MEMELMDEIELEIYNVLNKLEKLDASNYSSLVNLYGEELVNQVIEKMIDINIDCLSKFDYYISKISYVDDAMAKDLYEAYAIDLNMVNELSREENVMLATEIYNIVVEINELLNSIEYSQYNQVNSVWISEKVDACLKMCDNSEILDKLKKLYSNFLNKRNMLVEGNLKLVISVGKKYYKKGIDINDIIQLGNIGLMKVSERYNPKFNTCFSTYAYYWIKQNITRNLSDIICPVTIPYNIMSFNVLMKKNIKILRDEFGREPTVEEIADYMGVSLEKVNVVMKIFADPISLNESVNFSSDDDNFTLMDAIEDRDYNTFNIVVNKDLVRDVMEVLVNNLSEVELDVLCHRYELNNCSFNTLQELGIKYGVSGERIRQIENKALSKFSKKARNLVAYIR